MAAILNSRVSHLEFKVFLQQINTLFKRYYFYVLKVHIHSIGT